MEPQLYSFFDKKKLTDLVTAFHDCIGLPVQILDENGMILQQYGERTSFCNHFTSFLPAKESCLQIHAAAGRRALNMGEAYIFSCHSNLTHIVFPLSNKDYFFGSILVGPFLMQEPDSTMIMDISNHYPNISMEDLMELYDDAKSIRVIEPNIVSQISKLLYYLFINLTDDSREQLIIKQAKLHQQAKISESMHFYKDGNALSSEYPLEKEQELFKHLKAGNLDACKAALNDILGYVFLAAGNNIDSVKTRSFELCALLSRAAMESGAPRNQILKLNNHYIRNLNNYNTVEDICYSLNEVLTNFVDCIFPTVQNRNSKVIQDAMLFISQNYSQPITLEIVAKHVHLNSAYLSRLFKQVCGSTFKEYLTIIRIEESKRMLKTTNYSLLEIALATGFEDQSYFTKVFKKYTGTTPKQFRS